MLFRSVLRHKPDGVFLSNGPGDPAATGVYAVPTIKALIASGVPIFGICLGHQMLAIALGARTEKLARGHRGANHPVKDLATATQPHVILRDMAQMSSFSLWLSYQALEQSQRTASLQAHQLVLIADQTMRPQLDQGYRAITASQQRQATPSQVR